MNSSPRPYLNVARSAVHPARHQQHLFVLHVDALHRADALGELEDLRLAERRRREPATVLLPDDGRVEALLDRGPHGERRGEDLVAVVVGHHEVRAVAGAELVDLGEQVVGGVAREHVGEPGLDTDADQRQPARGLPLLGLGELLVAELHPALLVRRLGVRLRQAHRHVEVVGTRRERAVEDRHVEDRVDRVHHVGDLVLASERLDGARVGGVDLGGHEPVVVQRVDRLARARLVVVGDHADLEEVTARGDGGERRADAAGADQQDPHVSHFPRRRQTWCMARRRSEGGLGAKRAVERRQRRQVPRFTTSTRRCRT